MDVFKNLVQRTFCSTSRYVDGKEKSKKTKDKGDNKRKRKEKTRESEKRSNKKERTKIKIRKEKENMKENQQAAVEKSLPGVQACCAVLFTRFFMHTKGLLSDQVNGQVVSNIRIYAQPNR